MTGPYAQAAWKYRDAGWAGVIPVGRGPGQKSPPATGYTGWAGLDPSGADIQAWVDGAEGVRNIGLHVPVGIYVLDVDDRHGGAASLAAILRRLQVGLPAGPTCTARGAGQPTRHHFFRATLPEGRVWLDHPGGKESGLDSLHAGHRYAVTWPSINPETGTVYEWYDGEGELYEGVFSPGDLPDLPAELVAEFSRPGQPMEGTATGTAETVATIRGFRPGPACARVTRALNDEAARISRAGSAALHEPGSLFPLAVYGLEGHAGVAAALSIHQAAYVAARVAHRGDGAEGAGADWWRQVCGAIGKKLHALRESGEAPPEQCTCGQKTADTKVPQPDPVDPDDVPAPPTPDEAREILADAGPDADTVRAAARGIARQVAAHIAEPAEVGGWKDLLKSFGRLPNGEFAAIVKATREAIAARDEAAMHAEHEARRAEAAEAGTELPMPGDPLAVARKLVDRWSHTDGISHDAAWRGDLYRWTGTHWRTAEESTMRRRIYQATENAMFDAGPVRGMQPWRPDTGSVNAVLDALATAVIQRNPVEEAVQVIACANGVYDLGSDELLPHHPSRFNLSALPYSYDPHATCPQWETFLSQVIPDPDGRAFLQEWAGYLVSGRVDMEKMAVLVGAKRSGKGTVARVFRGLLGEQWVTTPKLSGLAEHFGKQPLIGKLLATFSDVDWKSRGAREAVEDLLAISGEDNPNIPRKNHDDWTGHLTVRLMLLSNDSPDLPNASGALASRMVVVTFGQSFLGREDIDLTRKLTAELPGIFRWALAGLRRLEVERRFTRPQESRTGEIAAAGSPVMQFVDGACTLIPGHETSLDGLYEQFRNWWESEGKQDRDRPDKPTFSRWLLSAYRDQGVDVVRRGRAAGRYRIVGGLECHWVSKTASDRR